MTLRSVMACWCLFWLSGCAERMERVPLETRPSWPIATPEAVGLDGKRLNEVLAALPPEHGLRSFLVIRHGALVSETYWNGYDQDTFQDLRSATKSITSLLVGVALSDASQPISRYLDIPAEKQAITVGDLLTMRSGLDCDDRLPSSPGHEDRMYASKDWVNFFLELDVKHERGTVARYCTGGVVLLGRIIEKASAARVAEFARTRLWEPLGIEHARWATFDDERGTDTGGHLRLRPRDFAKLGQLVLNRGAWKGQQLVPAAWIEQSTREQTRIDAQQAAYGALWWLDEVPAGDAKVPVVYASGNGGQLLFIVPALDLVVVSTGGNYNASKQALGFQLFAAGVLRAVSGP
jgi:CubicO group peptidase (beta-lactamase class C family)